MTPVVIIGAGGHAQVVADVLLKQHAQTGTQQPLGYLDDDPRLHGHHLLGLPVLGPLKNLFEGQVRGAAIIAIGSNAARQKIAALLEQNEIELATAVHPSAVIGHDVLIGPGSMICAGAIINPGTRIGRHVIINTGATVDHHNTIGDFAHLAPGTHTGGDVAIGEGAFVGIGAVVLPQQTVGRWATVGGGGMVRSAIPDQQTVVGVPARPIKR